MKRLLTAMLALLLLLGTPLAGAEEPVTIDFWHAWGSGANYDVLKEMVEDFNAQYAGRYRVVETFSGSYADTLSKAIVGYSAGENPTVSTIDACMTLNAQGYGILANLSELAAADGEYDMGGFMPGMMMYGTDPRGNVWSLPFARSTQIMYINADAVKEAMGEATIPKTWNDLFAIAKAWKALHGTPCYSHNVTGGFFARYVTSLGGEYLSADGNAACVYLNDGWQKALELWRQAIDEGYYLVPSLSTAGAYEDFMAGKLPIYLSSTGNLTKMLADATFDIAVFYTPGGLMDDGSVLNSVPTGGANLCLYNNKSDRELEAGWAFIKYMTSYDSNIKHSLATGYVVTHLGADQSEAMQAAWTQVPALKVAYDQLQFVHDDSFVSPYYSEFELDLVDVLSAFVSDGLPVEQALKDLVYVAQDILPGGAVDTF